jgi:hypothetical protein
MYDTRADRNNDVRNQKASLKAVLGWQMLRIHVLKIFAANKQMPVQS